MERLQCWVFADVCHLWGSESDLAVTPPSTLKPFLLPCSLQFPNVTIATNHLRGLIEQNNNDLSGGWKWEWRLSHTNWHVELLDHECMSSKPSQTTNSMTAPKTVSFQFNIAQKISMDCTQLSNAFNIVLQETPMIDKKKLHCDNSAQSAWLDVWQRVLTFSNNTFKGTQQTWTFGGLLTSSCICANWGLRILLNFLIGVLAEGGFVAQQLRKQTGGSGPILG